MRHFILTVFCSFLSSGNLQTYNNALNYQMPPGDSVLGPEVNEEIIWPVQAYQTFRGNFYGTARRSINTKPCMRQSNQQDVPFEQTKQFGRQGNNEPNVARVQEMNTQLEGHGSNTQDMVIQPPINNQVERQISRSQYVSVQQPENNQLINQVEEPSPTRRSSLTESENKTETLIESANLHSQEINDETQNPLRSGDKDEISESLRISSNIENTQTSETMYSTDFPTNSEFSYRPDSSEYIENHKHPESISQEDPGFKSQESSEDRSLEENISKEKYSEHISKIYKIGQEDSFNIDVTTDFTVTPPTPLPSALREQTYSEDISKINRVSNNANIQCSQKNPSNIPGLPEAPRRSLLDSNSNPVSYQSTVISKNYAKSGPSNIIGNQPNPEVAKNPINTQGTSYSSYTNSVLRKTSNHKHLDNRNQNQDVSSGKINKDATDLLDKSYKKAERSGNFRYDPTQGQGISYVKKTTLMLMDHERICYACSTANNPTCSVPDRKTAVKYCRKGDNACVTKTFGSGNTLTLIRDCGRSCTEETPGLVPKFKTCSICHTDLCNAAYSINVHSLILIIPTIVLIVLVKPLL